MAHIICSSESHNGAFLYLAHTPRTSVVIHSGCNIRAFLFDSVLLHIFSYEATFISSYFCPLNVSIHSLDLHLWISIFPFSSLIISWCNLCVSSLCLQHINAQFGVCCRCNVFFSLHLLEENWFLFSSTDGLNFTEQYLPESITQWPFSEKAITFRCFIFDLLCCC